MTVQKLKRLIGYERASRFAREEFDLLAIRCSEDDLALIAHLILDLGFGWDVVSRRRYADNLLDYWVEVGIRHDRSIAKFPFSLLTTMTIDIRSSLN